MAFAMTHLLVADNIRNIFSRHIIDLPQFYLGSIAPDSIHNREGYVSDYKKASHLCVGPEKWGYLTNNDENAQNALNYLCEKSESGDFDFLVGYCTHILTDIYNNIALWTIFKQKYPGELKKGYESLYYQENSRLDLEFALTHEKSAAFWRYLSESHGVDLYPITPADESSGNSLHPDIAVDESSGDELLPVIAASESSGINGYPIITSDEIEKQKGFILNSWYKGRERQDISSNILITYDILMAFIDVATEFTERHLRKVPKLAN